MPDLGGGNSAGRPVIHDAGTTDVDASLVDGNADLHLGARRRGLDGAGGRPDRKDVGAGTIDAPARSGGNAWRRPPRQPKDNRHRSRAGRQLYTATIIYADGRLTLQAFHASIARSPAKVVERLRGRFCDDLVALADIRIGFHGSAPLVIALVPHSLRDVIVQVEKVCGTSAVSRFAIDLEQRVEL